MLNNLVTHNVSQFDAEHTADGPAVVDGSWVYYPDGATREVNPLGALQQPPAREDFRTKRIAHYYGVVMERLAEEFDEAKEQALNDTDGDHDEKVRRLRRLRHRVRQAEARYSKAKEAHERTLPTHRTQEQKAAAAATAARLASQKTEIEAINI